MNMFVSRSFALDVHSYGVMGDDESESQGRVKTVGQSGCYTTLRKTLMRADGCAEGVHSLRQGSARSSAKDAPKSGHSAFPPRGTVIPSDESQFHFWNFNARKINSP